MLSLLQSSPIYVTLFPTVAFGSLKNLLVFVAYIMEDIIPLLFFYYIPWAFLLRKAT